MRAPVAQTVRARHDNYAKLVMSWLTNEVASARYGEKIKNSLRRQVPPGAFIVFFSRNYIIRQFYFMMSVVLYNLWILINPLLSMFLFGKISKKLAVTAKLFGTILCKTVDPGGT